MSEFCVWKCFELLSESANLCQGNEGAKQKN